MKRLQTLLLLSLLTPSANAGSFYGLGQVGGFYADNLGNSSIFTGRVGLGYERDIAINLRADDEDHLFFCFNYGIEIAYQGYQKKTEGNTVSAGSSTFTWESSYQRQTVDVLGVFNYHPLCNWDIFLKLGPGFVFQKSVYHSVSTANTYERNFTTCKGVPKLIFGIGYDVMKRANINLAFINEFDTSSVPRVRSLMAGLQVKLA